jgi:hypothetical protein|nr:hypothetical protein [Nitrosomonas nitrosa]
MMQTAETSSDARELQELQLIIERLASGEISKTEAEESFGRIWNEASKESALRRVLREFFPSLCGSSST